MYDSAVAAQTRFAPLKTRQLAPPQVMTGGERRRLNPNRGLIKLCERYLDMVVCRFVFPFVGHLWSPYCRVLERNFALATTTLAPAAWPRDLRPLRALLITDIHAGIFLKPQTLWEIIRSLIETKPDMVLLGGDLVTGHTSDATPYLPALAQLRSAPLGAWFCFGNHDYFGGDPAELEENLAAVGIKTLKNESVELAHGGRRLVLGGIDDRIMGQPDWNALTAKHGAPHILLAHNPDFFYEAEARGVPLMLSGHTHGGQIRLPRGPAIIRQSRYCLDEGVYAYRSALLVVSRGLGSVALPFRWGADPEAVLIDIVPPNG
ncbi:MAG TPA: metallophosphoesterase [Methylomirabilota bacterium]|jgi:predicted MPP superfamily phosphohydrolase|nr:metallophosphoesterase [Methylomirabilota bacterium]